MSNQQRSAAGAGAGPVDQAADSTGNAPDQPDCQEGRTTLDIVGFGSVALDELLTIDGSLNAGKGQIIDSRTEHGGNVSTALVAAVSLGARAGYIGSLSRNPVYASIETDLRRHGVDLQFCRFADDATPILSTVLVDQHGERFIAYRNGYGMTACQGLEVHGFAGATVLLIDGYAVDSIDAVQQARQRGIAVVGDIEWSVGAATEQLIDHIDHLVIPWEFAEGTTGHSDPCRILDALWSDQRSAVVITRGEQGAFLRARNHEGHWHVPAHDIEVVDTTGCGDWFHGAYAVGITEQRDVIERVQMGSAAAAIAAGGQGGRGRLATTAAVQQWMARAPSPVRLFP